MNNSSDDNSLETADAVARAAHLWIRSLCINDLYEPDERHALVSGLVAGLCERLALNARVQDLIAYVYALLDNEGSQALEVSQTMWDQSVRVLNYPAYEKGRSEAAGIVEMLTYHDQKG